MSRIHFVLAEPARPSFLRGAAGRAAPLSIEGGGIHLDVSETGSRQPCGLPAGPACRPALGSRAASRRAEASRQARRRQPARRQADAKSRPVPRGRSLGRPNRQPPQQLTSAGSSLTLLPGQGRLRLRLRRSQTPSARSYSGPREGAPRATGDAIEEGGAIAIRGGRRRAARWRGALSEEDGDALSDAADLVLLVHGVIVERHGQLRHRRPPVLSRLHTLPHAPHARVRRRREGQRQQES
jgi:hypothetical protein